MYIKKVTYIKSFGSFIDYTSDSSLPEFKKFNLIYGWNRSGKTTFSRVLRCFETNEKFEDCLDGEFEFVSNSGAINHKDLDTRLNIRVFNKDFIEDNISWEGSLGTNPIFYLGEDNIELNKKIKGFQEKYTKKDVAQRKASHELQDLIDKKDGALSTKAHEIKTTLTTSKPDKYRNYDKRDLEAILTSNFSEVALTEQQFLNSKQEISQESMGRLSFINKPKSNVSNSLNAINKLLEKSIVTQTINRLKDDPELSGWVRSGLIMHKKKKSNTCQFCGQSLPHEHLETLEKHFNDEYEDFLNQIKQATQSISSSKIKIELHDEARLYKELQNTYAKNLKDVMKEIISFNKIVDELASSLKEKESNVFKKVRISLTREKIKALEQRISTIVDSINSIVGQHNTKSESFDKSIQKQKETLEIYLATKFKKEYERLESLTKAKKEEVAQLNDEARNIGKEITRLQQELISSHIPVRKINDNLVKFFGHDEIQIKVNESDDGYQITRNNELAKNLSESEKTTIALIYFLIKIRENNFAIKDGIIVIDDPVSSMDTGFVFQAFGFIKAHVKDAGQVFILTHNFEFFRQVKNWFIHLLRNRITAEYFMLECNLVDRRRKSILKSLDKLLLNFESEYHYLFSLVYRYVNESDTNLERAYPYPNIARKFLESFLAFKVPTKDSIHTKLGKLTALSEEDRTKVLRFVDTHSHLNTVNGVQDIDMNLLSEATSAMSTLLELVKTVDADHYRYLEESMNS